MLSETSTNAAALISRSVTQRAIDISTQGGHINMRTLPHRSFVHSSMDRIANDRSIHLAMSERVCFKWRPK